MVLERTAFVREFRRKSLRETPSLVGSTGLLHVRTASSGAPGTLRLGVYAGFMSTSDFLCPHGECRLPGADPYSGAQTGNTHRADRTETHFVASATLAPYFELFGGFHSMATYNDQGRPQLKQVFGDTNLGGRLLLPPMPHRTYGAAIDANLWMLSGTGSPGLDLGATGLDLRAIGTLDLSKRERRPIPVRLHANLGYEFDNAGQLVLDHEKKQGYRISRIERYALDVNRTDNVNFGLGVEYANEYFRPFAEWSIEFPINRQGYTCWSAIKEDGQACLGEDKGLAYYPSRLTLGAKATPFKSQAVSFTAAFDIATGGSSHFLEEVAPETPWKFLLGVGWAFDTTPVPDVHFLPAASKAPPPAPPAITHTLRGTVVDAKTLKPVPNAMVRYQGLPLTGMVTGEDGLFASADLPPGNYSLAVTADGYNDGQCPVVLPAQAPQGAQPAAAAPTVTVTATSTPEGGDNAPNAAPAAPRITSTPKGDVMVEIRCDLKPLRKVGQVDGVLIDASTGKPLAAATIKITDKLGRSLELTTGEAGEFRFENVPVGSVTLTTTPEGYSSGELQLDVERGRDHKERLFVEPLPNKGKGKAKAPAKAKKPAAP